MFKPGDKVLCIDDKGTDERLLAGVTYTILHTMKSLAPGANRFYEFEHMPGEWWESIRFTKATFAKSEKKDTNLKDAVGIKKWRVFSTIPATVEAEVGVAMLEGSRKYGRHNYRVAGVRGSVYYDAARGHMMQWWEGEDIDPDSGLSHITKAIASLVVLRDAMIQDQLVDDRPPPAKLDEVRKNLQQVVDKIFEKYPESVPAHTKETT